MRLLFRSLFLLFLLLPVSLAYSSLGNPDLTARMAEINEKRAPMKMHEKKMHGMEKNSRLADKRFPIKMWGTEYNSLGRKRAPIDVKEKKAKKIKSPKIVEMKKVDSKMARGNQRRAYVRNWDRVKEKDLKPRYRDAKVTHIDEMSRPAMSPKSQKDEPSMREINRFSFQRNHRSEPGAQVDRAGSGEKASKRQNAEGKRGK